jgi:hypothetical protein
MAHLKKSPITGRLVYTPGSGRLVNHCGAVCCEGDVTLTFAYDGCNPYFPGGHSGSQSFVYLAPPFYYHWITTHVVMGYLVFEFTAECDPDTLAITFSALYGSIQTGTMVAALRPKTVTTNTLACVGDVLTGVWEADMEFDSGGGVWVDCGTMSVTLS